MIEADPELEECECVARHTSKFHHAGEFAEDRRGRAQGCERSVPLPNEALKFADEALDDSAPRASAPRRNTKTEGHFARSAFCRDAVFRRYDR